MAKITKNSSPSEIIERLKECPNLNRVKRCSGVPLQEIKYFMRTEDLLPHWLDALKSSALIWDNPKHLEFWDVSEAQWKKHLERRVRA